MQLQCSCCECSGEHRGSLLHCTAHVCPWKNSKWWEAYLRPDVSEAEFRTGCIVSIGLISSSFGDSWVWIIRNRSFLLWITNICQQLLENFEQTWKYFPQKPVFNFRTTVRTYSISLIFMCEFPALYVKELRMCIVEPLLGLCSCDLYWRDISSASALVSPIPLLWDLACGQDIVFKTLHQLLISFEFWNTETNWMFECI